MVTRRALDRARDQLGISSRLILCFLRHLTEQDAQATLDAALPYKQDLAAVGLDSGERGNPPGKFARVFARARAEGLRAVAHAGEEGPASYVREALDELQVKRIDHGVRCEDDPALVERLVRGIPLTVCPLSNVKLQVFRQMSEHNLKRLLNSGLCVTVNSDDPAYFGGYIRDNFLTAVCGALSLSEADVLRLAHNAVQASFLPEIEKHALRNRIEATAQAA